METIVKVFENVDHLSAYFGEMLKQHIHALPVKRGFTISLSGGSTPRAIFNYLAKHFNESIAWSNLRLFWGDERCVTPDSQESNYRMAVESLISRVAIPKSNVFRIEGEKNPPEQAKEYQQKVIQNVAMINGRPAFDLFMLGLGEDGHTASIFPNQPDLFVSEKLFEVAIQPESGQQRITATPVLINQSRNIVFLVTGESKAGMVARILKKHEGWEHLPAAHIKSINGNVYWLLDKAAASKLN
ncbi:6-phosphogluconolactonase [Lentimicrobium sp.]